MRADSPDLVSAKRLLDTAKQRGFQFRRTAPGPDGPLEGIRQSGQWRDVIYLAGFSRDCHARRERTRTLILPGSAQAQIHTQGSALDVLIEVLGWPELPP